MFRAADAAGAGAPGPVAEDQHKEQEKDAGDLKKNTVSHASEGANEPAQSAADAATGAGGLLG